MNYPPQEKNSQEAGMNESNHSWRGKGKKWFLKRHETKSRFAAASSDVTAS
jgi:hypothetical protein